VLPLLRVIFTIPLSPSISKNDSDAIIEGIRENHRLLVQISVVPEKVQQFIADIEKTGGAAKICGAGAVSGEGGGILWVKTNADISKLLSQYGYQIYHVEGDPLGTRIIHN
jgi:mevalonate kinase